MGASLLAVAKSIYYCFNNIGSLFLCACIVYQEMKHLESSESTQIKSQNDHPSPEIPHEIREVCDIEGGTVCS